MVNLFLQARFPSCIPFGVFAAEFINIILIQDVPEFFTCCDRIHVMYCAVIGRAVGQVTTAKVLVGGVNVRIIVAKRSRAG